MKTAFRMLLVFALAIASAQAQTVTAQKVQIPLTDTPQAPTTGSASVIGNSGPRTLYYWIVANFTVGASSPGGPFVITNAPNQVSGANYVRVSWGVVPGATSYDVLRTGTAVAPTGACGCAVTTGATLTTFNNTSDTLGAYTVNAVTPSLFQLSLANEGVSAGASHLILRQYGTLVADLSIGSTGTVTKNGNLATNKAIVGGSNGTTDVTASAVDYVPTWLVFTEPYMLITNTTTKTTNPPAGGFLLNVETSNSKLHCWTDAGADCMPSGGVTNSAGTNVLPKADAGGNLIASSMTDVAGAVAGATTFDVATGFRIAGVAPTGDVLCGDGTNFVDCVPGNLSNTQAGATYAVVAADRNKWLIGSRSSAMAWSIAAAGSVGFTNGYVTNIYNSGSGAITLTPATSTVNGAATLVIPSTTGARLESDGANYTAIVGIPKFDGTTTTSFLTEAGTWAASGGNVSNSGTPTAPQQAIWINATSVKGQDKPALDLRDCTGVVADGSHDDGPSINACLAANPERKFIAPTVRAYPLCTYYSSVMINLPSGTWLDGGGGQFGVGTRFCFPAGVTGLELNAYTKLSNLALAGSEDSSSTSGLGSGGLVVPNSASLDGRYAHGIGSLQRATGVVTAQLGGGITCAYKAGQIIQVTGVAEDTTFNGTYYIASAICSAAVALKSITWAQAGGPDVGLFSPAAGVLDVATTGTSTADGILVNGNLSIVDNVGVSAFGRDGVHFGHTVESDDNKFTDVSTYGNRAAGFYISGNNQKNQTQRYLGYFNTLNCIYDNGFLGNEHYSPQCSYNGTGPGLGAGATYSITSISRTGGVITFAATGSTFVVGHAVVFAGVADSSFNTPATTAGCYIATAVAGTYTCVQPGYALANSADSTGTARAASIAELNNSLAGATGVYAIGLDNGAGHWTLYSPYDEGGQPPSQYGYKVLVIDPLSGNGVDPNLVSGFTLLSETGTGPSMQTASGFRISASSDSDNGLQFVSGTTATTRFDLSWLDYTKTYVNAQMGYRTPGNSGEWLISDGDAATNQGLARFGFLGTNKTDGVTFVNSRGATTVDFNLVGYYNSTTVTGTGGVRFGDGRQNVVASVDGAGKLSAALYASNTNCAAAGSAANPSLVACAAAPTGAFSCDFAASGGTCVVSTTAVTANSNIIVKQVSYLSTRLSVTCTATPLVGSDMVTAITPATNFTVTLGTFTNSACFVYWITD